jgi:hypothetical protein
MFAKPITYSKPPMLPRVPNRILPSQDRKKLRILQDSTIERLSAESMNSPKKNCNGRETGGRREKGHCRDEKETG